MIRWDASVRRLAHAMGIGCNRDGRRRRIVLVIECILNQNARDAGAAAFPALNWEVLRLCHAYEVGVVQMPCPEIASLGFARTRPPGTSIRAALDTKEGRERCRRISVTIVDRIQEYVDQGYQLLAILGGNPDSPGCAVHVGGQGLLPTSGVLIRELEAELRERNLEAPFRGIRDCDPDTMAEDLKWLEGVFSQRAGRHATPTSTHHQHHQA
jgi:predicted secreted protein